ncbi:MAG: hypothetical protein ACYTGH_14375 [Planctomycetota bacterium]
MTKQYSLAQMRRECKEDEAVGLPESRIVSQDEILAMVKAKRDEAKRREANREEREGETAEGSS